MPTLSDIKRRIRSVESTEQITRAMKMIAGARLRRAQERMLAMRPYTRELARLIASLLPELAGDEHTLLEKRAEVRRVGVVLITPDRGLCGGLPGSLVREVTRFIESRRAEGREVVAFVSGRKGRRALGGRSDIELALVKEGDTELPTAAVAESLARAFADAFEQGRIDEGYVIYAEFRSAAAQETRCRQVLPIERESLGGESERGKGEGEGDNKKNEPAPEQSFGAEFEPDIAGLFEAAARRHLGAVIYAALLEGAASELGARLTAMDAATRNANDLIGELTLQYNKARQAAITAELMDIGGGVEALR